MSADLSVVATKAVKANAAGFGTQLQGVKEDHTSDGLGASSSNGGGNGVPVDPRTWLVLYCGANAKVEAVREKMITSSF